MTQNDPSDSLERKVWYKIYFSDVTANLEDIDKSSILISPLKDWDDLKRLLILEVPDLDGYHAIDLRLYCDEESLKRGERIRSLREAIGQSLGTSSPIVVSVPGPSRKKITLPGASYQ